MAEVTECLTKKGFAKKMECWICGGTADSQEHFVKASDIKGYYGKVQNEPLYKYADTTLSGRILSVKSDKLTFRTPICRRCNNQLTQPYDNAWELFSKYLQDHWPIIVKNGYFDLSKVFPKDTRQHALHVHLYFVKLLGCKLVEEGNVRINIESFSQALLQGTPHKDVFLTFANAPEIPINDDQLIFCSRLRVEYCSDDSSWTANTAHWIYMLHPVSIRTAYLLRSAPRAYRFRTWHPSQRDPRVRLGNYHIDLPEEYIYVPFGRTL